MATFPNITPDYFPTKASQPATRVVKFGDGAEQRLLYGLHQNLKIWSLSFSNLTETQADEIETFLDARAEDAASFDWTPPGSSTAYKWVCDEWTKTIPYVNRATINASFRQVPT